MTLPIRQDDTGITFDVQVVPRASRDRIGPVHGDRLKVQICAPPVDGEANEAVRAFLAKSLGVPRARVEIVRGETGRKKTIRVGGISRAAALEVLK